MFLERIIYNHVKNRLQWYVDDPVRFERFLIEGGLASDEIAAAKQSFIDNPPAVIMGYARQGGPFPCLALVLGNESTAQDYLGEDALPLDEDGEQYIDPYTGEIQDVHIRRWEHRMDWYLYADHPDRAQYYYYLLRHLMVGLRSRLQSDGLDEIQFSGAELAPDPRYMPADMFTRRFSITFRADESYVEDYAPGVGEGKTITGLAVEDNPIKGTTGLSDEEQADLNAATYGVTPYLEDDNG